MDLTSLRPEQVALLAVIATIVSTVTAAVTAFVVAKANQRGARLLAQDQVLRDYRQTALQPLLTIAATSMGLFGAFYGKIDRQDVDAAVEALRDIGATGKSLVNIGYMSITNADRYLHHTAVMFDEAHGTAMDRATDTMMRLRIGGVRPAGEDDLGKLFRASYNLHLAAEDFICGTTRHRAYLQRLLRDEKPAREALRAKPPGTATLSTPQQT